MHVAVERELLFLVRAQVAVDGQRPVADADTRNVADVGLRLVEPRAIHLEIGVEREGRQRADRALQPDGATAAEDHGGLEREARAGLIADVAQREIEIGHG